MLRRCCIVFCFRKNRTFFLLSINVAWSSISQSGFDAALRLNGMLFDGRGHALKQARIEIVIVGEIFLKHRSVITISRARVRE